MTFDGTIEWGAAVPSISGAYYVKFNFGTEFTITPLTTSYTAILNSISPKPTGVTTWSIN
jgi:hypothetical protein